MSPHRKNLVKLLRSMAGRYGVYDVFRDFVAASACALANACDPCGHERREAQYMQVMSRYRKDEIQVFPQALAELVQAFEDAPGDVLGSVFGELELGNAAAGQYFTPFSVCQMMAGITIDADEARQKIAERGYITVQEPACGAGAMVIAMAQYLQQEGINYQQHMHATCIDVDARAVHMAYVQFALMHIPAVLVIGNTLTLEQREVWHTPAHVMGLWDAKLRRGYALGSAMDTEAPPARVETPPPPAAQVSQPDLFGAAA